MRDVASMSGGQAAEIAECLTGTLSRSEQDAEGGEYLHISVWATRGFSATDIENKSKPENTQNHEKLGKVYRIPIIGKTEMKERKVERATVFSRKQ